MPSSYDGRQVTVNGQNYIIVGDIGDGLWSYGVLDNGTVDEVAPLYLIFTNGQ